MRQLTPEEIKTIREKFPDASFQAVKAVSKFLPEYGCKSDAREGMLLHGMLRGWMDDTVEGTKMAIDIVFKDEDYQASLPAM